MPKVYVLKDAAQVNVVGGLSTLMMAGSVLPENTDPDQLQHLLEQGIAVEGEFVGGLEPVLTGDRAEQLTFRAASDAGSSEGQVDDADDPDGPGGVPAKSAPKQDWVDYAVAVQVGQGTSEQDARALAEAQTKEQLVNEYGAA